ncbi:MAG: hypothetical protein JSW39_05425 [Desulfobacterales bacterium]|nr:MAG: hypothetical protein JSW39_05425 [Desulfobacterales bacterium]
MKHGKAFLTGLAAVLTVSGLALTGCAGRHPQFTPQNARAQFACVDENNLEKDVAAEAQLEEFSCSFKKWEGTDTLHFTVAVKNVSNQPQRFRVNIFTDNGKAVGGLIPAKTQEGLVESGQTASFVYPVKEMYVNPRTATLKISTISL